MKVLFLSQGRQIEDHPGWHWALEQLQREFIVDSFVNIPYIGYGEQHGWRAFFEYVVKLCCEHEFDVVYFHHWHGGLDRVPEADLKWCVGELRRLAKTPVILTSCGDGFSCTFLSPSYPQTFRAMSALADITFSTQMGNAADLIMSWGTRNLVLSPLAVCPVRFKSLPLDYHRHTFEFDVVWIGSRGRLWNPLNRGFYSGKYRIETARLLDKDFGKRMGLFGHGWAGMKSWRGGVPFNEQQSYFQKGRIAVDAPAPSFADYYASNRPFFMAMSGVPVVMFRTPRFDRILGADRHCYFCNSASEVVKCCKDLLQMNPTELYAKAADASQYVAARHTQYHRMKFKLDTARRYRENGNKLEVVFPFFLPEVDLVDEMKYAIRTRR